MDSQEDERRNHMTKVIKDTEREAVSKYMARNGKKAAARMTAAQKKHRARKAAAARWGLPKPEPEEDVPLPRRLL